jgi:hypothetical protein
MMAASSGKMPTTSVRRLISPIRRSMGWCRVQLRSMRRREGHVGQTVGMALAMRRTGRAFYLRLHRTPRRANPIISRSRSASELFSRSF